MMRVEPRPRRRNIVADNNILKCLNNFYVRPSDGKLQTMFTNTVVDTSYSAVDKRLIRVFIY